MDKTGQEDLCLEELSSKQLVFLGWKGAWEMYFGSNKCIFLSCGFWMKKKSIRRWWDEKKKRWGREAWQGTARRGRHRSGKAEMGMQCWGDRRSQSKDRSHTASVGGQTSPTPAAVFAQGRSMHNKFIIVLKTKHIQTSFWFWPRSWFTPFMGL